MLSLALLFSFVLKWPGAKKQSQASIVEHKAVKAFIAGDADDFVVSGLKTYCLSMCSSVLFFGMSVASGLF